MDKQHRIEHELNEVVELLRGFVPDPNGLSPARMIYLAGRASVQSSSGSRAGWWWPLSTAVLAMVSLTLAALLARQTTSRFDHGFPAGARIARDADSKRRPESKVDRTLAGDAALPRRGNELPMLHLRRLALAQGVQALGSAPSFAAPTEAIPTTSRAFTQQAIEQLE